VIPQVFFDSTPEKLYFGQNITRCPASSIVSATMERCARKSVAVRAPELHKTARGSVNSLLALLNQFTLWPQATLLKDNLHALRLAWMLRMIGRENHFLNPPNIPVHPPSITHKGLFAARIEVHTADKRSIQSIHVMSFGVVDHKEHLVPRSVSGFEHRNDFILELEIIPVIQGY
jgi:hypothetical protein